MENISYVGVSQLLSLQRQMDVTANNIANMSTPGFKTEGVLFIDQVNKAASTPQEALTQAENFGTYRDFSAGSLTPTYNDLDFAIQGEGYFTVQTPDGTRYTRDGSFSLNDKGEIVTRSGAQLMGDGGPIVVPADAHKIHLNADGSIGTDKGPLGKVKIVSFEDEQKLKALGGNLFDGGAAGEKPADKPHLEQGMIEASNVNPIVEMNKMINILRAYESSQRLMQNDHDRSLDMIQRLTRV